MDAIRILKEKNLDVPIIGNLVGPVSVASSVDRSSGINNDLMEDTRKEEAHQFR
ncbi:MAG: hypothetical protein ACLTKE_05995 [Coprococcus sp.]